MKYFLILLLSACVTRPVQPMLYKFVIPQNIQNSQTNENLEYETFKIYYDGCIATGAIINNKIVSAHHMFPSWCTSKEKDIIIIGYSEFKGLELCEEKHKADDILYYKSSRGMNVLQYMSEYDNNRIRVMSSNIVCRGESGTPVLCEKHNKVVGILTNCFGYLFLFNESKHEYEGSVEGLVTTLTLEDLK